jgi:hypothetical protein
LADLQTGVPVDTEPEAVAADEAVGAAPVAEAAVLEVPAEDVAETAADEDEDEDEAAHPEARTPAASSGTASSAFFTRSPNRQRKGHACMSRYHQPLRRHSPLFCCAEFRGY